MALCAYPRKVGNRMIDCRQCMNCRVNLKRSWIGRLRLEERFSGQSTFVTLTYEDAFLPPHGTLRPSDWRSYYDRIRHVSGIGAIRYYAVGEYGSKSGRPHYHALLFGVSPAWESRLSDAWDRGFTQVGLVTPGSIDYVAGYVTKKHLGSSGKEELNGRHPEFARMSRRPPIGAQGMRWIRDALMKREGSAALAAKGDVPSSYRIDNRVYPYTDYWRDWLRCELGVEKPSYAEWELTVYESQKDRIKAAREAARRYDDEARKRKKEKI